MGKEKKPFYKRWWFIVIIAFLFIGIIGTIFESDEAKQEREDKTEQRAKERAEAKEKREEEKRAKEEKKIEEEKKKTEDKKEVKKETPNKDKENKTKKDNKKEPKKENPATIEVDEIVTSVDYTAKVQRVKIDDDILTVVFDWENQSDWDPAHFPLLGYVEVKQSDEVLKQVGDTDRQNKQIKRNRFDVYDLEYELIDDSDITMRIVSTNEHDGSEGEIKISLE